MKRTEYKRANIRVNRQLSIGVDAFSGPRNGFKAPEVKM